ncbi:MAG TPA: UDP-glucose--hexose-1-phosphate uridylyltransferase [Firmicutes bacterium]|nr:UDP-glucose--hexose-1-phosphate uridylyltransferase [Bacillota bacterium]
MSIQNEINALVQYALKHNMITKDDTLYAANKVIDILGLNAFEMMEEVKASENISETLNNILDFAAKNNVLECDSIDHRDLLDTKIMDCFMPRPSEVNQTFAAKYAVSPKEATDYYYQLSQASNYIRMDRVAKNLNWKTVTPYGNLDITINLSKPEKDPKAIALAKSLPASNYPKCLLCRENVGFAGTLNHPARQNHRIIPLTLATEKWNLQYSPYVYYNEHSIVFKDAHEPMTISQSTFERLLDFVAQFNHYFIGSNADLPIVGGSILTHDHFQGGSYEFAMETAPILKTYTVPTYENVEVGFVKWPLSVLRLRGESTSELVTLGGKILEAWRSYSDESLGIFAHTDETPHNTITPIARFKDGKYELDLVLRNNRTSDVHPDGIYHPHAHLHHLKKENIGLIEVMGLAVLPGRLKEELEVVKQALMARDEAVLSEAALEKHIPWLNEMLDRYETVEPTLATEIVETEVGQKFVEILECCGVYKLNDEGLAGVERFINSLKA